MTYTILNQNNEPIGDLRNPTKETLDRFYQQIGNQLLKNEFFEILTEDGNKTGKLKLRDLIHKDGDWHGAFHMHVYGLNPQPYILFQKRAMSKDISPGKLDTAVGGHYNVGETIDDGVREANEETGLVVDPKDLVNIGRRFHQDRLAGVTNREVQDVTLYRCEQPLDKYTLQEEEVAALVKIAVKDVIALLSGDVGKLRGVETVTAEGDLIETDVASTDFWPVTDNYYLKTAMVIDAIIRGEEIPKSPYTT